MTDVKQQHYRTLPKRVKIGNLWFAIDIEDNGDAESKGTFGHMNPVNQRIRVRGGMAPQLLASVLIHEMIHAIYFNSYLFGPDHSPDEETVVRHTTAGLCQLWQDNPEVLRWWSKYNALEQ